MSYSSTQKTQPDTQTLWDMLQTMRPANSAAEKAFIKKHLDSVKGMKHDSYGNRYIRIGKAPVAWSCHTDTVHKQSGSQRIVYNKNKGIIALSQFEKQANCLGADDTAGVWLMLELIKHKKEGLYIFHRAEEIGGLGSDYISKKTPELVEGINIMIALDRKGTDSIITHQMGGRCASDSFAASLANQLEGYKPDSTGSFTDSANYTARIPECTNLSCGYESAHSPQESLDYFHLIGLRDSLLALDYSKLIVERTPAIDDYDDDYWRIGAYSAKWTDTPVAGRDCRSIYDFCESYPDIVADLLEQYGITLDDLYQSAPYVN